MPITGFARSDLLISVICGPGLANCPRSLATNHLRADLDFWRVASVEDEEKTIGVGMIGERG